MQLTLHATRRPPHCARLVQAISAWSVRTRSTPSRHCRDARVYHTTTAMHHIEYTPSPTSLCLTSVLVGAEEARKGGDEVTVVHDAEVVLNLAVQLAGERRVTHARRSEPGEARSEPCNK